MSSEMLTGFIQNFRALEVRDGIGSAEFVTQWCGLTVARVLGGSSIASRRLGEWMKHDESIKLHIKSTNGASVAEANVQWIVKLSGGPDPVGGFQVSKPVKGIRKFECPIGIDGADLSSIITVGADPETADVSTAIGKDGKVMKSV